MSTRFEGEHPVYYTRERWALLERKRGEALRIMEALRALHATVITHGSIARGDVDEDSDVDIVVLEPLPPSMLEIHLERSGFKVASKELVQATPSYTPKVYFYLDYREERVVSLPLARLKPREREFYKWGGEIDYSGLKGKARVPGVNKNLRMVLPTSFGHIEYPIEGREHEAARVLGISIETVMERVRVLTRRRELGRTGVFVKIEIDPETPVEEVVKRLKRENPAFRRQVQSW
ncbi:MAG: nucleotidyltransferase domain-containing protein [Desulfurococcales archaeon]|nr:nucleotidyltransferase domain-containing protein [Desulfurococcales archaeon]